MASNNGKLTRNEEGYVQSRLQGISQRQSYKDNYKCAKASDKNIDERACRLEKKPKVKARLDELMGKVMKKAEEEGLLSATDVLRKINELILRNEKKDDKVALEALKTYGKHHKLFTDKVEHSGEIKLPTIKITK